MPRPDQPLPGQPFRGPLKPALRALAKDVIETLMDQAGIKTQVELSRKTGISTNQISRYVNKTEFPEQNLTKIARRLGYPAESAYWLLGRVMMEKLKDFSLERGPRSDEVREPQTRYHLADLDEMMAGLKQANIEPLPSDDRIILARNRHDLLRRCKRVRQDQAEEVKELRESVAAFWYHYDVALRRKQPG